jgi:glycerol-3-phosphate dehydrogenase
MAQDAVDRVTDRPCRTKNLPLVGAGPGPTTRPAPAGVGGELLLRRYGTEAGDVAAPASDDTALLEPVAPGVPVLGVELLWAVRAEGALTVEDVIERRTRAGLVPEWADAVRAAASEHDSNTTLAR